MLELTGRIDTNNAAQVEKELQEQLATQNETQLVFDAAGLEYISSAGLRVLLRLRKQYPDIRLINVRPDVYDILDMTGFTAVMKVDKAYRSLSLDGCVEIAVGMPRISAIFAISRSCRMSSSASLPLKIFTTFSESMR